MGSYIPIIRSMKLPEIHGSIMADIAIAHAKNTIT
jgi:hypothetical protein